MLFEHPILWLIVLLSLFAVFGFWWLRRDEQKEMDRLDHQQKRDAKALRRWARKERRRRVDVEESPIE